MLAIMLFELTRAFRSSTDGVSAIYSKDQFTFKILHFFSTLRLAKPYADGKHLEGPTDVIDPFGGRRRERVIAEDSEEDLLTEDEDSGDPLTSLIAQLKHASLHDKQGGCANCRLRVEENANFRTLYKTLIENVITNL